MRVFLAGSVQGSSSSVSHDQSYREDFYHLLKEKWEDVEVLDPTEWTRGVLDTEEAASTINDLMSSYSAHESLVLDGSEGILSFARKNFWMAAREVVNCDVCIAYLPGDGMSMGTAMEMALAHEAGIPIVVISKNRTNLAVLSAASVVVSQPREIIEVLERFRGPIS